MEETQPWILPLDTNEKETIIWRDEIKWKMYKGNLMDWKKKKRKPTHQ